MTIGRLIDDYDQALKNDKTRQAHFVVKFTNDKKEDCMSYNDNIIDYMNCDLSLYDGEYWNYRKIITHKDTHRIILTTRVVWLMTVFYRNMVKKLTNLSSFFCKDAPVDCAKYSKKHGLLNKPGWRRFKLIEWMMLLTLLLAHDNWKEVVKKTETNTSSFQISLLWLTRIALKLQLVYDDTGKKLNDVNRLVNDEKQKKKSNDVNIDYNVYELKIKTMIKMMNDIMRVNSNTIRINTIVTLHYSYWCH